MVKSCPFFSVCQSSIYLFIYLFIYYDYTFFWSTYTMWKQFAWTLYIDIIRRKEYDPQEGYLNCNYTFHFPRPQSGICRCPCSSWKGEQTEASPPRTQTSSKEERERLRGGEGRWQRIPNLWLETLILYVLMHPVIAKPLFLTLKNFVCLLLRAFSCVYLTDMTSLRQKAEALLINNTWR